MVAVNFGNVLSAAQQAFKSMLAHKEFSHFVVVSSTTDYKVRADEAVYAGTKHAQVGFTRSLGLEAKRLQSNVKITLFMPDGMQTPFWEDNEPSLFSEFLDPAKVADHMATVAQLQDATF